MITDEERAIALQALHADVSFSELCESPGDVPVVRLGRREVAYETGSYDGWSRDLDGELRLAATKLDLNAAVDWLVYGR